MRCYVDEVIDILDPKHKEILHRLYKDICIVQYNSHIKDLRVITDHNLGKRIIVDNCIMEYTCFFLFRTEGRYILSKGYKTIKTHS